MLWLHLSLLQQIFGTLFHFFFLYSIYFSHIISILRTHLNLLVFLDQQAIFALFLTCIRKFAFLTAFILWILIGLLISSIFVFVIVIVIVISAWTALFAPLLVYGVVSWNDNFVQNALLKQVLVLMEMAF